MRVNRNRYSSLIVSAIVPSTIVCSSPSVAPRSSLGIPDADDAEAAERKAADLEQKFARVEESLCAGPFFADERLSLVDAVFGPIFRSFDAFEDYGAFAETPKVGAWSVALMDRHTKHPQCGLG